MAEITRRRTGELLQKLFEILMKHPDGLQASDALKALADSVKLSAYEAGVYESGSRRFEKIVRFATVDCVKAGWLLKHKGTWTVTEVGAAALERFTDAEAFYREAVRLYRAWKNERPEKVAAPLGDESEVGVESAQSVSLTFEQADEQAWAEIEQYLRGMNPFEFQHLVADLIRAMGYQVAWVSPPGKDGGVDVFAHTDPLGTKPPRIKIQVKRVSDRIRIDDLKSFIAIVNEDDVGLYVSTGALPVMRKNLQEIRSDEKLR